MFSFSKIFPKRVRIQNENIYINNQNWLTRKSIEINYVFSFKIAIPEFRIYENNILIHTYKVETLNSNPDLTEQFFHSSIRILPNSAVMIDGIISKSPTTFSKFGDIDYEAIRLQPFFLSNANKHNIELIGKGLIDRGLHFSGTITPSNVRSICICDNCKKSFTIKSFHAGFSDIQYFYSTNSKQTLTISYGKTENMPTQLQKGIDLKILKDVEEKLPKPSSDDGQFRYYNSFRCPHCLAPYIDFEKYPLIRPQEYYGNTYINCTLQNW